MLTSTEIYIGKSYFGVSSRVALDLNISREALSHYENGKRSPDLEMLRKLSKYFDVSIDFLVNGEEFNKK